MNSGHARFGAWARGETNPTNLVSRAGEVWLGPRPVVCFDETPVQLIGESRVPSDERIKWMFTVDAARTTLGRKYPRVAGQTLAAASLVGPASAPADATPPTADRRFSTGRDASRRKRSLPQPEVRVRSRQCEAGMMRGLCQRVPLLPQVQRPTPQISA